MRLDRIATGGDSARVVRALRAQARAEGLGLHINAVTTYDWASVTFAGTRHRIEIVATGDPVAIAAWTAALPEREWSVPGSVVVDVTVDRITPGCESTGIDLAILTVFAD
jgi:5,10-methylene-tetrahydrofolate dehydrogenase/methenyl tetrahydrofolate cyclohydrolase